MSFEEFRRANAHRPASAAHDDDADIKDDERYERSHERWTRTSGGRRVKRTPIWRWSAGTWATIWLTAMWFVALETVVAKAGPNSADAKGWMSIGALVLAVILGPVTWRMIGGKARDMLRAGVRLLPLLLLGSAAVSALVRQVAPREHARVAPPTDVASSPATPPPAPTTTPTSSSPPAPAARPQAERWLSALAASNEHDAEQALDQIEAEHRRALTALESSRRVPSTPPHLADNLKQLDALRPLVAEIARYANAHTDGLVARARYSDGAAFALRFAAPTPAAARALAERFARDAPDGATALDGLDALARAAPTARATVLAEANAVLGDGSEGALLSAWLSARLGVKRDRACRTIAAALFADAPATHALANHALKDLSPKCEAAGAPILEGLARNLKAGKPVDPLWWSETFGALAFTGRKNTGAILRFAKKPPGGGPRGGIKLYRALEPLAEQEFLAQVGTTRLVYQHPTALQGVTKPEVELGPCAPKAVGMTAKELAAVTPPLVCVHDVKGARIAGAPLGLE